MADISGVSGRSDSLSECCTLTKEQYNKRQWLLAATVACAAIALISVLFASLLFLGSTAPLAPLVVAISVGCTTLVSSVVTALFLWKSGKQTPALPQPVRQKTETKEESVVEKSPSPPLSIRISPPLQARADDQDMSSPPTVSEGNLAEQEAGGNSPPSLLAVPGQVPASVLSNRSRLALEPMEKQLAEQEEKSRVGIIKKFLRTSDREIDEKIMQHVRAIGNQPPKKSSALAKLFNQMAKYAWEKNQRSYGEECQCYSLKFQAPGRNVLALVTPERVLKIESQQRGIASAPPTPLGRKRRKSRNRTERLRRKA